MLYMWYMYVYEIKCKKKIKFNYEILSAAGTCVYVLLIKSTKNIFRYYTNTNEE